MRILKLLIIILVGVLPTVAVGQSSLPVPPLEPVQPIQIPPAPLPGEVSLGQPLPVLPTGPIVQQPALVPPVPMSDPAIGSYGTLQQHSAPGFQYPMANTFAPVGQPAPYYWRVGTRDCGQTFKQGINNCKLAVYGCDPNGRWRPSNMNEMLAAVGTGGPICIMVHGSLVDEFGSRVDSRGTYRWLRSAAPQMPLHVIFFDWPSQRCIGPHAAVQFIQLGRQAARNGFALANLVCQLPDSPVCLIGHSHGARVVCSAAHLMGGGEVQGRSLGNPDQRHRMRLVLAAAAIDHDWLNPGERYCRAVARAENIVSMENKHDPALLLYPLQRPFGTHALGQKGLHKSDEKALGHLRNRIFHLDVAPLVRKRHVWPYYYDEPRLAHAVASSFYFPEVYGVPGYQNAIPMQQTPVQHAPVQIGTGVPASYR